METLHLIILILHILGACLIIGGIFSVLLLLQAKTVSKELMAKIMFLGQISGKIMGVQLLTGIYLIASEPDEMAQNPYIGVKFVLFILAGLLIIPALKKHKQMIGTDGVPSDELVAAWRKSTFLRFALYVVIAVLGIVAVEMAA